jgi:allantoicase
MSSLPLEPAVFSGLADLAARRVGGQALLASDEFFAEKENLLEPGRGVFIADKYTDRGKWMDGWESRRKRVPGHDWCIVKLGLPGVIRGFDIDTNHFLGNHPPYASVEACAVDGNPAGEKLAAQGTSWSTILPRVPLKAGSQNLFAVADPNRWTHLRLNIYPDGGVARFRAYGRVVPDWSRIGADALVDVAAIEHGGRVTAASDMFFGNRENLIMPGRGTHMGDGWESRRRRGPGHDWAVVELGRPAILRRIEVDTAHFKGNYPDRCSIDACWAPGRELDTLTAADESWLPVLAETKLAADRQHQFESELAERGPWTHVRLNIYPDGGVSRLRVFGTLAAEGASR